MSISDHPTNSAHLLDRPVWNALTTRQNDLAQGGSHAWRFAPDIGAFAAAADSSPESLAALADLIPSGGSVALVEIEEILLPKGAIVTRQAVCHQMVAPHLTPGHGDLAAEDMTDADAPSMLALASLTKPGPFFAATHRLGGFVGIKLNGELIAMAGQRMRVEGYTEVSGVCTHPDHRGRGYAAALIRLVGSRILQRGEIPFLQTYADNTSAIALYHALGFVLHQEIIMTTLEKP